MLYCQLTSNLLNYPNVERFLQNFKPISMKKDVKLKEEVKKINNNIHYDYFCDSIKLLIRFYRKMVVTIKDPTLPLEFERKQFPIRACFAMTSNKSQGQTIGTVGIYLPTDFFAHGQLYVAMSRVQSPSDDFD